MITKSEPEDPENSQTFMLSEWSGGSLHIETGSVCPTVAERSLQVFLHFAASWPRLASGDGVLARLSSLAASARPRCALYPSASARVRPGTPLAWGAGLQSEQISEIKNKTKRGDEESDAEDDECICRGSFDLSAYVKCLSPQRTVVPLGCSRICVLVCTLKVPHVPIQSQHLARDELTLWSIYQNNTHLKICSNVCFDLLRTR